MFYLLNFFRFLSEERFKGVAFLLLHLSLILFALMKAPSRQKVEGVRELDFVVINQEKKSIRLSPLVSSLGVEFSALSAQQIEKYVEETLKELRIHKSSLLSSLYFSGGTLIFRNESPEEIEMAQKKIELALKSFDVIWGDLNLKQSLIAARDQGLYYGTLILLLLCYFLILPSLFKKFSSDSLLVEEFQGRTHVMSKSMGLFLLLSLTPLSLFYWLGRIGNPVYLLFILGIMTLLFLYSMKKTKWHYEI